MDYMEVTTSGVIGIKARVFGRGATGSLPWASLYFLKVARPPGAIERRPLGTKCRPPDRL